MLVVKRRNIVIAIVLALVFVTSAILIGALKKSATGNADASEIKIVLDAGHGGIDGGVTGRTTGVKESTLNLQIVKKLEKNLISAGINVILTRSSDSGLYGIATKNRKKKDMQKRKEIIEKEQPDLVVSIHMNYYSMPSRRGAQVFYKKESETGKALAKALQRNLNEMEQSSRDCNALTGDYYILNCSNYPSVIVECGFLSNAEDEKLLISDDYQRDLTYTIFKGIVEYLTTTTSYGFGV